MAVELYDEHEQGERVRKWIREYASSIVLGLVLAFGGIFGFRQWQEHQVGQQALAAEYYHVVVQELELRGLESAVEQFHIMQDAASRSAFTGLAGMLLAAAYVEDGQLGPAEAIYREILDNRRLRSLEPIATLRLARVLEARGDIEEALELIGTEPLPGYRGLWAEVRGDLLFERGRLDEARVAWEEALEHQSEGGANLRLLQIKIDSTGPGGSGDLS